MIRVLVVDDEIEACNALKEFFGSKDCGVETALDGKTALEKIEEFGPHIVFLDVIMPGMGGMDVLREIANTHPEICVVMTTAVIDEETAQLAKQLGAYDYVTKPIDLSYLDTVLLVKKTETLS